MCECCGCTERDRRGRSLNRKHRSHRHYKKLHDGDNYNSISYDTGSLSDDDDECCCEAEKGQALSITGVVFSSLSLVYLGILFISFCSETGGSTAEDLLDDDSDANTTTACYGIYNKGQNTTEMVKVTRFLHIVGMNCTIASVAMWCSLLSTKLYKGRTIPVILTFVFNFGAQACVSGAALLWTIASEDNGYNITFSVMLWITVVHLSMTFTCALTLLTCSHANKHIVCKNKKP